MIIELILEFLYQIFTQIFLKFFGTNLSDTHGMKSIKRNSFVNELQDSIRSMDAWYRALAEDWKKGEQIKEVPVNVNEIRPSVYNIGFDIPKTLYLILKLSLDYFLKMKLTNTKINNLIFLSIALSFVFGKRYSLLSLPSVPGYIIDFVIILFVNVVAKIIRQYLVLVILNL